jgi:hypothetical protein
MTRCQFPVFCYFCVLEKLHMKYSQNWTKQKPKSLITWHEDRVQRRAGDGPGASHTLWWRGLGLAHATRGCDRLVHPLTSPFRLYILLDDKTLGPRTLFQKTYCKSPPSSTRDREGQKLFPAPCQRGESPLEAFFITMSAFGLMCE